MEQWLSASGFTKVQAEREAEKAGAVEPAADAKGKKAKAAALLKVKMLDVVADRFRLGNVERARAYEAIEVALKRGSGVLVEGRLEQEDWTDKDGGKRSKHKIIASRIQFTDSKAAAEPADDSHELRETEIAPPAPRQAQRPQPQAGRR